MRYGTGNEDLNGVAETVQAFMTQVRIGSTNADQCAVHASVATVAWELLHTSFAWRTYLPINRSILLVAPGEPPRSSAWQVPSGSYPQPVEVQHLQI
ncbi:MAG TPA: hypothetical protein VFC38_03895 [Stellaceae bacterium]|nr:hypothetical protein [Stellaceae bacterium]